MRFATLLLSDINPFDRTHVFTKAKPGFRAVDMEPGEHWEGALRCAEMIGLGIRIRPISVCPSDIVPKRWRDPKKPWQRLDGFKRYWGHGLLGITYINCLIFNEYALGPQHGQSMEVDAEEWARLSTS